MDTDGFEYLTCGSHRARETLERLMGYRPEAFYSFEEGFMAHHYYKVPTEFVEAALRIKMIRRPRRLPAEMRPCWRVESLKRKETL